MNKRALGIVIVVMTLTAGCEQPRNVLSQLLIQPETAASLDHGIQWQIDLGLGEGDRVLYAELLGDRLVLLESQNILTVINAETSEILWRDQVGRDLARFSKPVRQGDRLIISSVTRTYIYEINQGDLLEVFPLAYSSSTTPAIHRETMIHGSPTGLVFSQELNLGLLRWRYQTGSAITNNPALVEDTALVTNAAGEVLAFNALTGALRWRSSTYGSITAELEWDDRLVYAASEDQSLYAFDLNSGELVWRYFTQDPLRDKPMRVQDVLLLQTPQQGLVAIGVEGGEARWSREGLAGAEPLMLRGSRLYLHLPEQGVVEVIDIDSGETIERVSIPAVHEVVADRSLGGGLYLVRANGRIMKLTPQ